jgi:hypothetical protein
MIRFGCICLALALAGCVATPTAPPAGPEQEPDHRRLIAENVTSLFSPDAKVQNVAVSELRRVLSPAGLVWGACVRVDATGVSGKPTATRTFIITFRNNVIAERRPASGTDCADARFEPLRAA